MVQQQAELVKLKLLTLVAISVLQPVSRSDLADNLESKIDGGRLDLLLEGLQQERAIARDDKWFRLTFRGEESISPGRGRKLRDIQRMEFLVKLTKERAQGG